MSNEIAIRIENVGKRYRYGGPASVSYNLRQDLMDWAKGLFGSSKTGDKTLTNPNQTSATQHHASLKEIHERHLDADPSFFWALKNVNLEIKQGEVVGIIGRNGAGKSTLLKILSRITPPSTGRIEYHGRVASLLEVGTGFHRELTGRENIYLSGSILGMKRAEIARKFSEIISFAEVEKFIDTPVKFYSSGMYVRLAFAVAAHLDPEILLVDEVLAVGDAAFQKKCLGKMSDVAQQGRTVLFVSHNMGAVNRLCSSAVLLSRGSVVAVGEAGQVIRQYTTEEAHTGGCYEQKPDTGKPIHLRRVRATAPDATVRSQFTYHEAVTISIDYDVHQRINGTSVGIGLFVGDGTCAFCSADFDCEPTLLEERAPGSYTTKFTIPAAWLNTDTYIVNVYIANASTGTIYDRVEALSFQIIDSGTPGSYHGAQYRRGVLQPLLQWKTETRTDV